MDHLPSRFLLSGRKDLTYLEILEKTILLCLIGQSWVRWPPLAAEKAKNRHFLLKWDNGTGECALESLRTPSRENLPAPLNVPFVFCALKLINL